MQTYTILPPSPLQQPTESLAQGHTDRTQTHSTWPRRTSTSPPSSRVRSRSSKRWVSCHCVVHVTPISVITAFFGNHSNNGLVRLCGLMKTLLKRSVIFSIFISFPLQVSIEIGNEVRRQNTMLGEMVSVVVVVLYVYALPSMFTINLTHVYSFIHLHTITLSWESVVQW